MGSLMKTCRLLVVILCGAVVVGLAAVNPAWAVPEISNLRIADVTPTSFSMVWVTDVAADPTVEVYTQNSLQSSRPENIVITPLPAESPAVVAAAKQKGVMKVRVSGLQPATKYYVRAVTQDPANAGSVGYSTLQEVTTATLVAPYRTVDGSQQKIANDLASMSVYLRSVDLDAGLGDLLLLEVDGSTWPVSAFVGEGAAAPEGVVDLNNLFDLAGVSREIGAGQRVALRIYRGNILSTLRHYRKTGSPTGMVEIVSPVPGFFADLNLDGSIDDGDFTEFKKQYRTSRDDAFYNPDFDFVTDAGGNVDARDFSAFSKEYGRSNVP